MLSAADPSYLESPTMAITLTVNDVQRTVDADPDTPLLWILRDSLNLTGTKFGCGVGLCGACTVHLNGAAVRACQTTLGDARGAQVATIESLQTREAKALRQAWNELDVPQCGYCQSGQIMKAADLLKATPKPSDAEIDGAMDGNVCRCASYQRIRAGIHRAAEILEA